MTLWKSSKESGRSKVFPFSGGSTVEILRSVQSQHLHNAALSTQDGHCVAFQKDLVKLSYVSSRCVMAILRISRKHSVLLWPAMLMGSAGGGFIWLDSYLGVSLLNKPQLV